MAESFDRLKRMKDEIAGRDNAASIELDRVAKELDKADVPTEVWIGTDSTADRVTWLITRNKLNQQNSRSRFKAMNELADFVEAVLAGPIDESWHVRADEALVLAGRRQP